MLLTPKNLKSIVELGRPKFLVYSPMLYALGAIIARLNGSEFSTSSFILGLCFVWTAHVMTHYCNEYYDLPSDKENHSPSPWTGGSRVLVRGDVEPRVSLAMGKYVAVLAAILAAFLPNAIPKIIASLILIFAWGYTAPPLRMCSRGMGELGVTLVLNILTPLLGFFIQSDTPTPLLAILAPLAVIEYIRMMVMNMADREADQRGGKTTLIVLIGIKKAVWIHAAGMLLAYGILAVMSVSGYPRPPLVFVALTAPLGAWQAWRLIAHQRRPDSICVYNAPFWASTHNGLCAAAALSGFISLHGIGRPIIIEAFPLALYSASILNLLWKKTTRATEQNLDEDSNGGDDDLCVQGKSSNS